PAERRPAAARPGRERASRLARRRHERSCRRRCIVSAAVDSLSATTPPSRETRAAWSLALPALMLFTGVVVIPLAMTVMLSFHDWGQYKGIEPVFILKNWREIASDPYYAEMFLRTFRVAVLATLITAVLGVPEAYILNRMNSPWKGFFLLVILGP